MDRIIEIINIHFFAFVFAMIGYVYSQVLTSPGMLLNGVWNWLSLRLPQWLFKPVIDCYLCVCGQMALWSGIYFINYKQPLFEAISLHVYFISMTIFFSVLINKIYEEITRN